MLDSVVKSVGLFVTRNSTTILTSLAVAGVVSTAVLAVRGTPGAIRDLEVLDRDFPDHTPFDAVKVAAPHYIPALATGTVTIASIIGAHNIGSRKNAAMASAYSLVERSFTDYRKKISETFGEVKAQKIQDAVIDDHISKGNAPTMIVLEDGEALCYEVLTGRYFRSSPEKMRRAQNTLNGRMLDGVEFSVSLNEFYMLCGIPTTMMGEEMGWNEAARIDIQLSSHLTPDEKPCLAVTYNMPPFPNFWMSDSRRWSAPM